MTKVVSLRIPQDKVRAVDRRAAGSGLNRTKYLLRLLDQELARPAPTAKRNFSSRHLLGKFHSTGSSNAQTRAALKAKSEKDR